MSRRGDGDRAYISRSGRSCHTVYKSLDENRLIEPLHREPAVRSISPRRRRYPARAVRASYVEYEDYYDSEEPHTPLRQRSAKRRRIISEEVEDIEAEAPVEEPAEAEEPPVENGEDAGDDDVEDDAPRKSARRRRRASDSIVIDSSPTKSPGMVSAKSATSLVERKSSEKENVSDVECSMAERVKLRHRDQERARAVAKEEEDTDGPRHYALRQRRVPVDRYSSRMYDESHKRRVLLLRRPPRRVSRETRPRRRYSSSSTDDSDDSISTEREAKDEAKFQRRQARSMLDNRARLMPVNLTSTEIDATQTIHKEKLRKLGVNTCADIDPMSVDQSVTFDQVGGLTAHLQSLKETVLFPLVYPEMFENFKITPPKGILFYGPPGTGKTLIARALANECSRGERKVAFFMRKGADCLSKWIGESERQLRLLFDQAYSMRPSIIFFDEIDGIAPVRSSRQDQIHSSIVSTMLALMDGLDSRGEVIVIGATNRLDSIDPALRRPGRFDRELRFSLPDKTARQSILEIHTKKWNPECQPTPEQMDSLAEATSGYCGADLRSLCAEAVLVAIRTTYPHIYLTSDKLEVDTSKIKVNFDHFATAMRTIVPACRRDATISSKQLHPRLACLMGSVVEELFAERIPSGYVKAPTVDNLYSSELERVVRALEVPPVVPAARLLLHGGRWGNQGQSHYFLPAIANRLDHLTMVSISCASLFSAANPEESLNQMLHSVIRATSNNTPTVLLLPDLDVLQASLQLPSWNMLVSKLESFVGFTTLLTIATVRHPLTDVSEDIVKLFGRANAVELSAPGEQHRRDYFTHILEPAFVPPKRFDPIDYPEPPLAKVQKPVCRMSESEVKGLEQLFKKQQREFRCFLRDVLVRLIRDRKVSVFQDPVKEEDAEDYYEIIKNPMCLAQMLRRVDSNEYKTRDQFMADIYLIRDNAIEYNPDTDSSGKLIRSAAFHLVDTVDHIFCDDFDENFEEKYKMTQDLLARAKGEEPEAQSEGEATESQPASPSKAKKTPKRSKKGKRKSNNVVFSIDEAEHDPSTPDEASNDAASTDAPSQQESLPSVQETEVVQDSPEAMDVVLEEVPEKPADPILTLDEAAMREVINQLLPKTADWSIPDLENLGAALTQRVCRFTNVWDRSSLPIELNQLITDFKI
uniref:Bromo domain-containing protein n=1 Tax=Panagrellus redivivus TaxID=6233 RepID=A0A7E4W5R0_PANRE